MKKDVIYIDVEDDITSIVGKIKASPEKIIALVPPNRVGVLQSAVNMRLLKRAADQASKRIVLISSNQSLMGLAGAASIPVARTLQSKPEIVEIPVIKVDNDDVIDGNTLAVGELAKTAVENQDSPAVNEVIESSKPTTTAVGRAAAKASGVKKTDKKVKVPNFSTFRKKLVLIIGLAVLLVSFLIWAIWFAPRASVIISAKTTSATIDKSVSLVVGDTIDANSDSLKAIRQEQKQDLSVEFEPTGKKKVGEKAKGSVRFNTRDNAYIRDRGTIPAGTVLTNSSGASYVTDSAATFSRNNDNEEEVIVGITATEIGENYNAATGRLSGSIPSIVTANIARTTSGGTSREVTVVSEADVAKAAEKLNEKKDDSLRDKLEQAFGSSSVVIKESYKEARSDYQPSVPVDGEASGTATLNSTVTGSMVAIDKADIKNYLKKNIEEEIADVKSQRIYEDGSDDVKFAQFTDRDGNMTVRLTANGKVGPTIDEDSVKEQSKGKAYGEIQSDLEAISGVDQVDVKFWPFWVRTVPNDTNRIIVEFKLQDAS